VTCPLRSTGITPLLHCFLRKAFERTNGIKTQLLNAAQQKELDETFSAISDTVKEIQRSAPNVSLGGMLAIVTFESGVRPGFFNTRDKENSFSPDRKNKLPKLDPTKKPYWRSPLHDRAISLGLFRYTHQSFGHVSRPHGLRASALTTWRNSKGSLPLLTNWPAYGRTLRRSVKRPRAPYRTNHEPSITSCLTRTVNLAYRRTARAGTSIRRFSCKAIAT
jgi:hypothetical protein